MDLTANQVTKNAEGKISYLPVRNAPAGTVIQYKATYSNIINKDIQDLAVVLPIPANMAFTGEANPTSAQASIDGKNYADMPLMRKVDGKMVKIPFSEYRTLRAGISSYYQHRSLPPWHLTRSSTRPLLQLTKSCSSNFRISI